MFFFRLRLITLLPSQTQESQTFRRNEEEAGGMVKRRGGGQERKGKEIKLQGLHRPQSEPGTDVIALPASCCETNHWSAEQMMSQRAEKNATVATVSKCMQSEEALKRTNRL